MHPLLDNPIIRREAVPRALRRAGPRARIVVAAVATLAPLAGAGFVVARQPDLADVMAYVVACAWAGIAIIVATIVCCRTIAYERALNTWDAVVMSRLGTKGIVLGKLLAVLLPLWMLGLVLAPALAVLLGFGSWRGAPLDLAYLLIPYAVALVAGMSFAALGLYCSMICSGAAMAETLTALVIAGVLAGAYAAASVVHHNTHDDLAGTSLFAAIALTPGFLVGSYVVSLRRARPHTPGLTTARQHVGDLTPHIARAARPSPPSPSDCPSWYRPELRRR
jgi:hypothetical protein